MAFTWTAGGPFSMEPLTGSLQPGESATITVVFEPKQALVYDVKVRRNRGLQISQLRIIHLNSHAHCRRDARSATTCRLCGYPCVGWASTRL